MAGIAFRGKHTGYKGIVERGTGKLYLVELLYDCAKKDPNMLNAEYTNFCFVRSIEDIETGEKVDDVNGYAQACYRYSAGRFIFGEKIFFFPVNRKITEYQAQKWAISYAHARKLEREPFGWNEKKVET